MESPNKPKYVKNKINRRLSYSSSEDSNENESSDESDFNEELDLGTGKKTSQLDGEKTKKISQNTLEDSKNSSLKRFKANILTNESNKISNSLRLSEKNCLFSVELAFSDYYSSAISTLFALSAFNDVNYVVKSAFTTLNNVTSFKMKKSKKNEQKAVQNYKQILERLNSEKARANFLKSNAIEALKKSIDSFQKSSDAITMDAAVFRQYALNVEKNLREPQNNESIPSKNKLEENKSKKTPLTQDSQAQNPDEIIPGFKAHIPSWGQNIIHKNQVIRITNTCTIDYYLFAFWVLSKLKPNYLDYYVNNKNVVELKKIIKYIDKNDWENSRKIYVTQVMNFIPIDNVIDVFGTDASRVAQYFQEYQYYQIVQLCSQDCPLNNTFIVHDNSNELNFSKNPSTNKISIETFFTERCWSCGIETKADIRFKKPPSFLFLRSERRNIFIQDIPRKIKINEINFNLLCMTIFHSGHFYGVFNLNNNLYLVNDIGREIFYLSETERAKKKELEKFYSYNTTLSFYYRD